MWQHAIQVAVHGRAVASDSRGLHRPQEEVPEEEAEESAYEEKEGGEPGVGFIEAQRKGEDVANNGEPTDEGKPDAVFVDIDLVHLQFGAVYLEVLFNPVPFAQPTQAEGGEIAHPVPERCNNKASPGVGGHLQHRNVEDIGTERNDGRRQKRADKQPPRAPGPKVRELRQDVCQARY